MFQYHRQHSATPHTAYGPLLGSPHGQNSNLIMEPSLSSNTAKDHFTIYHMGFNPLTGPLAHTQSSKAFLICSSVFFLNGKEKMYLPYTAAEIRDKINKAGSTRICRVSGTITYLRHTVNLFSEHL